MADLGLPCPFFVRFELRFVTPGTSSKFASSHPDFCSHFSREYRDDDLPAASSPTEEFAPAPNDCCCDVPLTSTAELYSAFQRVHDAVQARAASSTATPVNGAAPRKSPSLFSTTYLHARESHGATATPASAYDEERIDCITLERVVLRVVCLTLPNVGYAVGKGIQQLPSVLPLRCALAVRAYLTGCVPRHRSALHLTESCTSCARF